MSEKGPNCIVSSQVHTSLTKNRHEIGAEKRTAQLSISANSGSTSQYEHGTLRSVVTQIPSSKCEVVCKIGMHSQDGMSRPFGRNFTLKEMDANTYRSRFKRTEMKDDLWQSFKTPEAHLTVKIFCNTTRSGSEPYLLTQFV